MWLSADPAMGEYIPQAPINDDIRKQNQNLPGLGGVFNYVNLHVYHYAGNNPVKLKDPDGRSENDTVVDLNLFPKDQAIHQYAEDLKFLPDEVLQYTSRKNAFVVALHGAPDYATNENGHLITPKNLADRIKGHENYKPGQTVVLLSCETGKATKTSPNNYAQALANELGTPVIAADKFVWFYKGGNVPPFAADEQLPINPDRYNTPPWTRDRMPPNYYSMGTFGIFYPQTKPGTRHRLPRE
jgi:hypothetical protein